MVGDPIPDMLDTDMVLELMDMVLELTDMVLEPTDITLDMATTWARGLLMLNPRLMLLT